jgi:hypothetical protein
MSMHGRPLAYGTAPTWSSASSGRCRPKASASQRPQSMPRHSQHDSSCRGSRGGGTGCPGSHSPSKRANAMQPMASSHASTRRTAPPPNTPAMPVAASAASGTRVGTSTRLRGK